MFFQSTLDCSGRPQPNGLKVLCCGHFQSTNKPWSCFFLGRVLFHNTNHWLISGNYEKRRGDSTVWNIWFGGRSSLSINSAFGKCFCKWKSQGNNKHPVTSLRRSRGSSFMNKTMLDYSSRNIFLCFYFFGMGQGEEWVAGPWITVCWF